MVAAESEYDVAVSTRSWNIRACVWTIWKVTWLIDAFNFPISLEYGHRITVGYLRISLNLLFICTKYSHERLHHWFLSDTQLMCTAKLKLIQARYNICDWHFLPGWIFLTKQQTISMVDLSRTAFMFGWGLLNIQYYVVVNSHLFQKECFPAKFEIWGDREKLTRRPVPPTTGPSLRLCLPTYRMRRCKLTE